MTWLTAELPGTGGSYKELPEDFQVEELPLYPCSGVGEHLYLWIEKVGISTRELLTQLAKGLQLKERELGYAGLKDARARTRQMISIPARCENRLDRLELRKARILSRQRHGNKLRLGHLAGNRFTIRLRQVHPQAAGRAEALLQMLQERGVPNRFGEQRYGVLGNSAELGLLLLRRNSPDFCRELLGDPEQIRNPAWQAAARAYRAGDLPLCLEQLPPRMRDERRLVRQLHDGQPADRAVLSLPRNLLRLFLSAAQAQLFDQLLEQRLPDLDLLQDGDIAVKHANGACFRVTSAALEQPRAAAFEISPSAPLYGYKVLLAEGQSGRQESSLLEQAGLRLESWKLADGLSMPGERRPLRVPLAEAQILENRDESLLLSFCLPKGSYATSVLQEMIKKSS